MQEPFTRAPENTRDKFVRVTSPATHIYIVAADGVRRLYVGEAALWVLSEAMDSEGYGKQPAAAITDALVDAGIDKLPEIPADFDVLPTVLMLAGGEAEDQEEREAVGPLRDFALLLLPLLERGGPSITDGVVIKGLFTRAGNYVELAMRKIAEAGGNPLKELEEVHRRQRRIAVEVMNEMLARDRKARADALAIGPEGL